MKKIGILTLVFQNFGTRLQSYALCKTIKEICPKGLSFEVIDAEGTWSSAPINPKQLIKRFFRYRLFFLNFFVDRICWYVQKKSINKINHDKEWADRRSKFMSLVNLIPLSSKKYTLEDIRNGALNDYSEILVGSDQVWNCINVHAQDVYMLDYFKKKGYTYAVSFGMMSIPHHMIETYRNRMNHFNSLLIREEEGVKLCRILGRTDAKFVLDPTLLLKKDDYELLTPKKNLIKGDYILVYSLNASYKIYNQAYKIAKRNNCKMVVLKRDFCPPNIKKYPNSEELFCVAPEEFLWLVKNAMCVITNSYHGFLFSILFNKLFYLFLDDFDEQNCRMLSLVRLCHLDDRLFWEKERLPNEFGQIDYESVNCVITKWRQKSIDLLQESLNQMARGKTEL